jgi:hypothetical protein
MSPERFRHVVLNRAGRQQHLSEHSDFTSEARLLICWHDILMQGSSSK